MTTHAISPFTPLVLRLAQILGGLRTAVAVCGGRRMLGWDRRPDDPRIVPLIVPICGRIGRLMGRFERLVARLAAGWRPLAVPSPARARARPAVARARPDVVRLPSGFGWLVQLTHGASAYGGQLEALLAEPGMAALIAAAPGARRILRPLCRMLGVKPGPPLGEAVAMVPVTVGLRRPRQADGRFCKRVAAFEAVGRHWHEPFTRRATPR